MNKRYWILLIPIIVMTAGFIYALFKDNHTIRLLDESVESYKRGNIKLLRQAAENRKSIVALTEGIRRARTESDALGSTVERSRGILLELRRENSSLREILDRSEITSSGIKADGERVKGGIKEALGIVRDLRENYTGERRKSFGKSGKSEEGSLGGDL